MKVSVPAGEGPKVEPAGKSRGGGNFGGGQFSQGYGRGCRGTAERSADHFTFRVSRPLVPPQDPHRLVPEGVDLPSRGNGGWLVWGLGIEGTGCVGM